MPLAVGGRAPYAPFASIETLIEKHKLVGLPQVIDTDYLERVGITEALRPRTLASLRLLDFTDDDGRLTPEFDSLKRAPSDEVPTRLGQMLGVTYKPVFDVIGDPASASVQQIEDAFKAFEPRGQIVRMVQLFTGLMVYVGLMPEAARRKPGPKRSSTSNGATPAPKSRKVATGSTPASKAAPVPPPPFVQPPGGMPGRSHTVTLKSGGTVTLIYDVNLFEVSEDDEGFVLGLVRKLRKYPSTTPVDAEEEDGV